MLAYQHNASGKKAVFYLWTSDQQTPLSHCLGQLGAHRFTKSYNMAVPGLFLLRWPPLLKGLGRYLQFCKFLATSVCKRLVFGKKSFFRRHSQL